MSKLGGPPPGTVAAFAISRGNGNIVFIGTQVGLYRSAGYAGNAFQEWERLPNAPLGIICLAVSPDDAKDHTIVAGTHTGIFLSKDSGETWRESQTPISGSVVIAISFSPNYTVDGILMAGTLEDGIFFSDSRGESWHSKSFGLLDPTVFSLALSPNFARDETAFAGTDTAVYYSYNQARAWKELDFPVGKAPVLSLVLSPNFEEDHTLFVGTERQGLYRSSDRGENWQRLDLPARCINALLVSQHHPALFAATEAGIFLSSDQGKTWKCVLDLPDVISLVSMDELLIAGLVDRGVWETTNLVDWKPMRNLATRSLLGLVPSAQFERDLTAFLYGPQEGIWRTVDGGITWDCMNEELSSVEVLALILSPDFSADRIAVAASVDGVLLSEDAGDHWKQVVEEPAGLVSFSPNGKIITASFPEDGIRTTEDLGNQWHRVPGPWDAGGKVAALSVSDTNHHYVALLEGAGQTLSIWQGNPGQLEKVLSEPAGKNPIVSFFIPSERTPERPWYVSLGNRVWKLSSRKGRPVAHSNVFSQSKQSESILYLSGIYSQTSQTLFACTGQHLFKSMDAKSWTMVYDFGNERAVSFFLSPSYPENKTLYVLLLGGSFCRVVIH